MSKTRVKFYFNIVLCLAGAVIFGAGFFMEKFLPRFLYYLMIFIGGVSFIVGMDKTNWKRIKRAKYRTYNHYISNKTKLIKTLTFSSVFLYVLISAFRPVMLIPCLFFPTYNMILLCKNPKYLSFLRPGRIMPNAISYSLLALVFVVLVEIENTNLNILFAILIMVFALVGTILYYKSVSAITSKKKLPTNAAAVYLFLLLFFAGAILGINRQYDFTATQTHTLEIQDKDNHTLYFGQFQPLKQNLKISINSSKYELIRQQEAAPVNIHNGLFGMTWYDVDWELIENPFEIAE